MHRCVTVNFNVSVQILGIVLSKSLTLSHTFPLPSCLFPNSLNSSKMISYILFSRPTYTTALRFDFHIFLLIFLWIKGLIMHLHPSALPFPFTEGHVGKLQVWCRLSAFPSG